MAQNHPPDTPAVQPFGDDFTGPKTREINKETDY